MPLYQKQSFVCLNKNADKTNTFTLVDMICFQVFLFCLMLTYLWKKLGYLSCRVSHCWEFAACIPGACRSFSAFCKLAVGFRSLTKFRFDFGEGQGNFIILCLWGLGLTKCCRIVLFISWLRKLRWSNFSKVRHQIPTVDNSQSQWQAWPAARSLVLLEHSQYGCSLYSVPSFFQI